MHTIFIEFTEPVGKILPIYSWAIKALQKTKYSHVRLRWLSRSGVEIIYEASGHEVKVIGKEAQHLHKVKVIEQYSVVVGEEEYSDLIKLLRYAGVKYGKNQVIGMALAYVFNLSKNYLASGRSSQVCSELLGIFLKDVKKWPIKYDLDLAGPREIEESLKRYIKEGYADITHT